MKSFSLILLLILVSCAKEEQFKVENKIKGTKLRIKQLPQLAFTFDNFTTDVVVEIIDDDGNLATEDSNTISISFDNDASDGNGNINGVLQLKAIEGVATFNILSIDYPGSNYTIKASADGLESAVSEEFDVKNWGVQYASVTTPLTSYASQSNSGSDVCLFGAVDSDGYIYCAGYTDGNFISENAGSGTRDIFYVKIDPNTLEQVDSFQLGKDSEDSPLINSLSSSEELAGIEIDSDGNIYLVGYTTSNLVETAQSEDVFVVKLDKDKNLLWVKHYGNTTKVIASAPSNPNAYLDRSQTTTIDENGNLYIAGFTFGHFVETSYTSNSNYADGFIVKLDKDGNTLWATQLGENLGAATGAYYSRDRVYDIEVKGDYVFFVGETSGDWVENNTRATDIKQDVFFGKISAIDGATDCANCYLKQIGSVTESTYPFILNAALQDLAYKVAVDDQGNIYIAGESRGDFAVSKVLQGTGSSDPYDPIILKANSNGELQWAYQLGEANVPTPCDPLPTVSACSTDASELVSKIILDSDLNSYLLFRTKGNQYVDPITYKRYDSIILKLDKDGLPVGDNKGIYQFSGDRLYPESDNTLNEIYFDMFINNDYMYFFGFSTSDAFETSTGTNDVSMFRIKFPPN